MGAIITQVFILRAEHSLMSQAIKKGYAAQLMIDASPTNLAI
jgi:hypothetical protein